jgi:micrococcal nuclease
MLPCASLSLLRSAVLRSAVLRSAVLRSAVLRFAVTALPLLTSTSLPAQRGSAARGSPQSQDQQAARDSAPRAPVRRTSECHVTRIVDGDTIDCHEGGRVRLLGIDTPETSQRPFGASARAALLAMLPVGSVAQLEQDVQARDQYGRLLAYVWFRGKQINWEMVRAGWAVTLTYTPNVQYADWYARAQTRAREERLGLWRVDGFRCLPVDHRRRRC